jgi:tight adherence protein B
MEIVAIVGAAIFALAMMGIGVYTIRRDRAQVLDKRLEAYTSDYASELASILQAETSTSLQQVSAREIYQETIDKRIQGSAFATKWKVQLARADLKMTPGEFLGMHFVSVFGFFLVANILLGNPILGVMAGAAGFFAPRIWLSMKVNKRLHQFEDQLADNLQMWVNGLRSGYSVLQAVEAIAKEAAEPTSTEFRRITREVQLGIPLDEALAHSLERMPSEDFDLVITAVNIQREVGGNLAEILEVISHTIRERIKLKGEIRVMTAQGRITGYVIGGLPVLLLGFMMVVNDAYIGGLFRDKLCGWPLLGCGAGLIAMGTAAIQKIVDIEI